MNRDLSNEIIELKTRKEFDTFWNVRRKLNEIGKIVKEFTAVDSQVNPEIYKYLPVVLVSTMESYFRSTIKKLIDTESIYLQNYKKKNTSNSMKFNLDILENIHKRELTIGELISHQISFSKFENINSTFTDIIGKDFFTELKKSPLSKSFPGYEKNDEMFKKYENQIFKNIQELFRHRNIICHEMANEIVISKKALITVYNSVKIFLVQIHNYITDLLFPSVDEVEAGNKAKQRFEDLEKELFELIETIKSDKTTYLGNKVDLLNFEKAQESWRIYRDSYSASLHSGIESDSDYNLLLYDFLADMTKDRIDDLKIDFDFEEAI